MSNDLTTLPAAPEGLPANVSDLAKGYVRASRADSTIRAYQSHLREFSAWCAVWGGVAVPATATNVANYLAERATAGLRPDSLRRVLAALAYAHKLAGAPFATDVFAELLAGISRTHGRGKQGKAALETGELVRTVDHLPRTLAGQRDRALLLLGFAAALRRSELVGLNLTAAETEGSGHIEFTSEGLRVTIRRSKTDQAGQGQVVFVPHGSTEHCPVAAVRAWVDTLVSRGLVAGTLFPRIGKGDRLTSHRLTAQSVRLVVQQRVREAAKNRGLTDGEAADLAAKFAGHSLRSGALTSAAKNGAGVFELRDHARHKSIETTNGYVRAATGFKTSAAAKTGL